MMLATSSPDQANAVRFARQANEYLRRHQLRPRQIERPAASDLDLVVVVPCYAEPDITTTLDSLWDCSRPDGAVEVIVVINAPAEARADVQALNNATRLAVTAWNSAHRDPRLRVHYIDHSGLPRRHAGVGLARKLGMDEAIGRLMQTASGRGVIASLDADCTVEPGYLRNIEHHFAAWPLTPGATIYFEHRAKEAAVAQTIVDYELYLRYYVHALRYAGFPHAYHTVGSCMAVRSEVYAAQGGMNRRQAGEDFYFLHKLIRLGGFSEILTTTVYPAARLSRRTPFGTGRALTELSAAGSLAVYAPLAFADLRVALSQVDSLYTADADDPVLLDGLPRSVQAYLTANGFRDRLREIQLNTASRRAFRKRFFRWFDGFRVMKYLNTVSRERYPRVPVAEAAVTMLDWRGLRGGKALRPTQVRDLLETYRILDRQPADGLNRVAITP